MPLSLHIWDIYCTIVINLAWNSRELKIMYQALAFLDTGLKLAIRERKILFRFLRGVDIHKHRKP